MTQTTPNWKAFHSCLPANRCSFLRLVDNSLDFSQQLEAKIRWWKYLYSHLNSGEGTGCKSKSTFWEFYSSFCKHACQGGLTKIIKKSPTELPWEKMPCFQQFNTLWNWKTMVLVGGGMSADYSNVPEPILLGWLQMCNWPSLEKPWSLMTLSLMSLRGSSGSLVLGIWISLAARQHPTHFTQPTSQDGRMTHITGFWNHPAS